MALVKGLTSKILLLLGSDIAKSPCRTKTSFLKPNITNSSQPLRTRSSDKQNEKKTEQQPKSFRHNYSEEVEGAVNNQILAELNAGMVYLSMYCYYGRTDVALPGTQSFFKSMYKEEQDHAFQFIDYQLLRGGQVQLFPVTVPEDMNWTDVTVALGVALELEKRVKEKLENLARCAETHNDLQLVDFVVSKFLDQQNKSICELGRMLTKAKRLVDTGCVGRQLFDREVFDYVNDKPPSSLPFKNI